MIRCKLCGKEISREATIWNKKCGINQVCTLCIDTKKIPIYGIGKFDKMSFRLRQQIIDDKARRKHTPKNKVKRKR